MSGPQVYFSWPATFKPIPDSLPDTLPPPVNERSFRAPFGIDKTLFNLALRPEIPFAFASSYILIVFALNAYNRKREHKPWWISKTRLFRFFVVLHNVLLAVYSMATFAAMLRAIMHTWPEGGLTQNPNGAAGVADALCKLHGPRGLGDAATFNTTINIWEVKNTAIKLGYDGNPDPTDFGRLWNEGLAFWGWIFYMSKFYEVLDTFIILAKGKRSATLQTYHHAGAMLCMWAGIRYMSPPIWMFVFINSGIHGMMYTYFTLSALGYRVPQAIKRTLTSLQIAQFVFGASYAAMHLFVQYDIPVATPYYIASTVKRAISSASSVASEATSAAASATSDVSEAIASPTATATLGALLKKLLLRAAGEEGLAERVHRERLQQPVDIPGAPMLPTTPEMADKIQHFNEETYYETRWRTDWTKVDCIDTSGEAFAIYLNLLYLAPLTFLFARFFVKAYTQRGRKRSISQATRQALGAGREAERKTERKVERGGERAEAQLGKRMPENAEEMEKLQEQLKEDVRQMKEGSYKAARRVSERVQSYEGKVQKQFKEMIDGSGSGSDSPQRMASSTPRGGETPKKDNEGKNSDQAKKGDAPSQASKDDPVDNKKSVAGGEEKESDAPGLLPATPKKGKSGKKGKSPNPGNGIGAGANNESKAKQDDNMSSSKSTRPGATGDGDNDTPAGIASAQGGRDNTDAMGQSGSIIDLAREKASDAADEAEKAQGAGDPTLPQSRPNTSADEEK